MCVLCLLLHECASVCVLACFCGSTLSATYQLNELLVAHLSLLVALHQGEQHVQFGGVQLQLMVLHQTGEVLHCDETGVVWVQLANTTQ